MLFKENNLILAPMAGITEPVFRGICKQFGADIVVSEMVSAEGILYGAKATIELLAFEEFERPIGIQLFGGEPDHLARAAAFVERHVRPDFIDLNAGCPVHKVIKKNGGSSLLRDPDRFRRIVKAMVSAVAIPVTVKIRSGIQKYQWVDTDFAKIAEDCGAAAITLHPRSQSMMFSGHSLWERIAEVKKCVSIPVIGNGDVVSSDDAIVLQQLTGCDGIMIGRGAYGNPWLFKQIRTVFSGGTPQDVSLHEKLTMALQHLILYRERHGEVAASKEMKKHAAWYCHGACGASAIRNAIFRSQSYTELEDILKRTIDTVA